MNNLTKGQLLTEFDRQAENLIQKNYPSAARVSKEEFLKHLELLRDKLANISAPEPNLESGQLPFVIVVKSDLVSTEKAMSFVERNGKQGITKLFPLEPKDFLLISDIEIPGEKVYLLVNIDRGKEYLNVRPSDALKAIKKENRSPLTVDEGVAVVTHFPDFLKKNNCFSLLASRHTGDKRVPAIWINSKQNPNLGWCWDGNPHTWLGSASCSSRVA